mmetsp:Transcript_71767/g.171491  ORF Transcript_71767/g.171491 Transcript_71767/m.171491 type:complete len:583 (-) Transcript_71767:337-2085(-)
MDPVTHVHVREHLHHRLDTVEGEWRNLLQSDDGNILETQLLSFRHQLVVKLTGAEHEPIHLVRIRSDLGIAFWDQALEAHAGPHVVQRADALTKSEQILWRSDDQRLAEVSVLLPTQSVEVVRWRGDVHHLPVCLLNLVSSEVILEIGNVILIIVTKLKVALQSTGRVLRSLAHVAVGEEHDQAGLLKPLVLPSRNKLVDHHLRRVGEVTELCFPKDQCARVLVAVAQLEAQHAIFRKDGVPRDESFLRTEVEVVQEAEILPCALILRNTMPMREGAALDILSCDSHVVAFQQQGGKCEGLCGGPIEGLSALDVLQLLLELAFQAVVQLETLRDCAQLRADGLQKLKVNSCGMRLGLVRGAHVTLPLRGHPVAHVLIRLEAVRLFEGLLMLLPQVAFDRVEFSLRHHTAGKKLLFEDGVRPRMFVDLLVEHRLGILRSIRFVVPEASVTNHINDHILPPGLSPLRSQLESRGNCDGVVAVDVENGEAEAFAQVRRVHCGAVVDRVGGEAHLVVDDDVDGATDVELRDMRELQGLVADALASKGGVAMEKNRHDPRPRLCSISQVVLLGPSATQRDGVHCLQV